MNVTLKFLCTKLSLLLLLLLFNSASESTNDARTDCKYLTKFELHKTGITGSVRMMKKSVERQHFGKKKNEITDLLMDLILLKYLVSVYVFTRHFYFDSSYRLGTDCCVLPAANNMVSLRNRSQVELTW